MEIHDLPKDKDHDESQGLPRGSGSAMPWTRMEQDDELPRVCGACLRRQSTRDRCRGENRARTTAKAGWDCCMRYGRGRAVERWRCRGLAARRQPPMEAQGRLLKGQGSDRDFVLSHKPRRSVYAQTREDVATEVKPHELDAADHRPLEMCTREQSQSRRVLDITIPAYVELCRASKQSRASRTGRPEDPEMADYLTHQSPDFVPSPRRHPLIQQPRPRTTNSAPQHLALVSRSLLLRTSASTEILTRPLLQTSTLPIAPTNTSLPLPLHRPIRRRVLTPESLIPPRDCGFLYKREQSPPQAPLPFQDFDLQHSMPLIIPNANMEMPVFIDFSHTKLPLRFDTSNPSNPSQPQSQPSTTFAANIDSTTYMSEFDFQPSTYLQFPFSSGTAGETDYTQVSSPYAQPNNFSFKSPWQGFGGNQLDQTPFGHGSVLQQPRKGATHSRALSGSTNASFGSNSPYPQTTHLPYLLPFDTKQQYNHQFYNCSEPSYTTDHLPTPALTPNQETFELSLRQQQHLSQLQQRVAMANQQGPAPRFVGGDDVDEHFNFQPPRQPPKFDRTMTDVYSDELYNPSTMQQAQHARPHTQNLSTSFPQSIVNERLQQANDARTSSPRRPPKQPSPFRQTSPYSAQQPTMATAAGARRRQKAEADALAYQQHHPAPESEESSPKTISPKDAVLEYHEDDQPPLFPEIAVSDRDRRNRQSYGPWSGDRNTNQQSFPAASSYGFIAPSIPASAQSSQQSNAPFGAQLYKPLSNNSSQQDQHDPNFPPQLLSMDTSISDATNTTTDGANIESDLEKPSGAFASAGVYACAAPVALSDSPLALSSTSTACARIVLLPTDPLHLQGSRTHSRNHTRTLVQCPPQRLNLPATTTPTTTPRKMKTALRSSA
ncbi:hypothetical protein MRB53_038689 [Persea americana]|nr:hypothetical protein MRB53_038689 [Persea americana]